jgi:hypothetical protein
VNLKGFLGIYGYWAIFIGTFFEGETSSISIWDGAMARGFWAEAHLGKSRLEKLGIYSTDFRIISSSFSEHVGSGCLITSHRRCRVSLRGLPGNHPGRPQEI